MDEVGVPFAVTIDFTTFEDDTVTLRERDSTSQVLVIFSRFAILRNSFLLSAISLRFASLFLK
jgi:glycyl-tRNA synthetase